MRSRRGAIDMSVTMMTVALLALVAWYQYWYVYVPKQGGPPGWPITKMIALGVPLGLFLFGVLFAPRGGFTGRS